MCAWGQGYWVEHAVNIAYGMAGLGEFVVLSGAVSVYYETL